MQRGRTAHSLQDTKPSILTRVSSGSSTSGSVSATSFAARWFSIAVSSSSVLMYRTSKRRWQAFAQCPAAPQRRQVSGAALAFRAASMSMGMGLPGEGLEWANRTGAVAGAGRWKTEVEEQVEGAGALTGRCEAWKASSAARFWSIWTASSNQASGSISDGHPDAIPANAADMRQSSPQWNLTTMVFGSVYPESYMRSRN